MPCVSSMLRMPCKLRVLRTINNHSTTQDNGSELAIIVLLTPPPLHAL